MPRILAVDWDRNEVRCVLAATRGKQVRTIVAGSAPLVDITEGGTGSHPDIGGSLRVALGEHRPRGAVALIAVARASVEVMNFTLPPATDAELPELVENQAMRDSQALTEGAALDFTALDDDSPGPRQVVAAVLPDSQQKTIREACAAAGFPPQRIVLRPFAAASLCRHLAPLSDQVCLLVSLAAEEADLTILLEGRLVFTRTARLPAAESEEAAAERITAEVRRTLLVAQQGPLGGRSIEHVFLFGSPGEHQVLADRIGEDLGLATTVLDPFEATDGAAPLEREKAGRFAPLLGMIVDEAHGRLPAIDFLHPKRPPPPANRQRPLWIAAALLLTLAGGVWYHVWDKSTALDKEYRQLVQQKKKNAERLQEIDQQGDLIEAVRQWESTDVNWLDELRELSLRFPSVREAVVERISFSPGRDGGGSIEFQGVVREPRVVARIEQALRDEYHQEVRSKHVAAREKEAYAGTFEASVSVVPRDKNGYREEPASGP
ncbi:MAG: type IV pilus biogenesis protein PilM [Thermoguttaceae bacterium]